MVEFGKRVKFFPSLALVQLLQQARLNEFESNCIVA